VAGLLTQGVPGSMGDGIDPFAHPAEALLNPVQLQGKAPAPQETRPHYARTCGSTVRPAAAHCDITPGEWSIDPSAAHPRDQGAGTLSGRL
jgi:hypothetical protein